MIKSVKTKNRNFYRKQSNFNYWLSTKYTGNNAKIYEKRAKDDYDKYVYNGGRLSFSEVIRKRGK